ncbi:unnamed protein product [Parnassius apollo]|uniref:(apollo) hypothetical protein n=1 Tax=Parnassius apollo TaxID=110799 RepID=A0A8S3XTQ9_PARAO|nr:unnamed protein product [Parnassius apollo]
MNNEATVKSAENTPEAERIPEPVNEDCSTQNPKTQPQISKLNMPLNDTKLSPLKKNLNTREGHRTFEENYYNGCS